MPLQFSHRANNTRVYYDKNHAKHTGSLCQMKRLFEVVFFIMGLTKHTPHRQ